MARKTALAASIDRAMKEMSREIVIKALGDVNKKTTIGKLWDDFASAGYSNDLKELTLEELASAVGGGSQEVSKPSMKRTGGGAPSTRTQAGRAALDSSVAGVLKDAGGPVGADAVRAALGGTSAQIRQALTRLMEAGSVSRTGQRRGTKYSWGKAAAPANKKSGKKRRGSGKKRATRKRK